ncbi:hypothetical protein KC363_g3908 [Hortaea werneckii]|uniref:DUF7918 domain-containing protein n=1 Tax=Hortaea werneckii TaxID=91943 RepID=A0A3M7FB50_HORWE|nr:hypothetical protein KC361_g2122 [Hortaea werneckii]KAI6886766.1 hypothetical protein KC325_g2580 [Hortaea werneckii]KAI6996753.1 hypothetical protein KC359_g3312 [Hortaea werneckii]KAI7147977.1 hypothetical protein KC344_g2299 [Hortaea werneckii]KAI7177534.1 hypothetical protein KC360_g2262 [Hortaea werneckii]
MAIHPNVPGLTVSIDVAGQDLPEYDGGEAQEASSTTVVKYIEAISGAEFAIAYRFDANVFAFADNAIVAFISCDGDGTSRQFFKPNTMFSVQRGLFRYRIDRGMNGDLVHRAMMFSDLTTSEAEVNKDLLSKLKGLGTIVVKWYKGQVVPVNKRSAVPYPFVGASLTDGRVPEKNLKGQAITHQTAYGRDILRLKEPSYDIQPIGEPFVTFEFRYRSRAALQSMDILPRSPSPIPLEDRNIEDLNSEEMRELLRRQQRQRESSEVAIKREIKRERIEFEDDDDDGDDVEIVHRPEKKPRLDVDDAGTEVVDLCGDD